MKLNLNIEFDTGTENPILLESNLYVIQTKFKVFIIKFDI